MVGAAFVVAVFGWGIGFYGPSVFLGTLDEERGWPVSSVSTAVTVHFLFSAVLVAYLPEAHRRWGVAGVTRLGVQFAAADVGKAVALSVAINQAVFAFAPGVLGVVRDVEGGYAASFALAGVIQLVAALIIISRRFTAAAVGGR